MNPKKEKRRRRKNEAIPKFGWTKGRKDRGMLRRERWVGKTIDRNRNRSPQAIVGLNTRKAEHHGAEGQPPLWAGKINNQETGKQPTSKVRRPPPALATEPTLVPRAGLGCLYRPGSPHTRLRKKEGDRNICCGGQDGNLLGSSNYHILRKAPHLTKQQNETLQKSEEELGQIHRVGRNS